MNHRISFALATVWLGVSTLSAIPVPAENDHVKSLDGTWRFKLEQPGQQSGGTQSKIPPIEMPKNPEPFQKLDYKEDGSWHDIAVPGNWEMAGFSPATYYQPDNAIGLYRLEFEVPADWQGRDVKIDFDGVQNGAEVFCNGEPVDVDEASWGRKNYHESGWTAFQADLTPVVKFGQKNLLAVRVIKNTKSADLDSGDFFFLGGIYRHVRLFSVPKAHIEDFAVQTKVPSNDQATVHVLLQLAPNAKASMQLEGTPAVTGQADAQGKLQLVEPVEHPRLWSAEHPNLYDLSVDAMDESGKVAEHLTSRVGIREITIKNGIYLINNTPVKLAGICRHDLWPTLGTRLDEEQYKKELSLMKASNINAIRTSHYPYSSKFYEMCDEMGFYVADEMAACWCDPSNASLAPAWAQHARETVRRDKNHPCVVLWAIGNENRPGADNKVSADEMKKIDTTRPRLVSWRNAEHADVELDDAHYTTPEDIAKAEHESRRSKYPKFYLENPNTWEIRNGADFGCTYRWGPVIDRVWTEVLKDEHIPGTFLWEWQDRAVADKCEIKLNDYFPETGLNLVKVKGLVDAFRNPRPHLYDVKMAYSPVCLKNNYVMSDDGVTLHVFNRYSFTNLSELKTTWHLSADGKEFASGSGNIALAPLTSGDIHLPFSHDNFTKADTLRIDFDTTDGRNVVTYAFRLKPEAEPPALETKLEGINFPQFNFIVMTYASSPKTGWHTRIRHPATLTNIKLASKSVDQAALAQMPLSEVQSLDATIMLPANALESPNTGKKSKALQNKKSQASSESEAVGKLHVDCANGHFTYRVTWANKKAADVEELGWTFAAPKGADHFSWHRQAYWSWYPENHIGRPEGTATPDSANVQLTKMERPDGFDFNSTKYDCDRAAMTGSGGNVAFRFDAKDRQHCRGEIEQNGGYAITVNKICAPPRDISSNVVPEMYHRFEGQGTVGASFDVGSTR